MLTVTPIFRISDYQQAVAFCIDWLAFRIDWKDQPANGPFYMQVSRGSIVLNLTTHEAECNSCGSMAIDFGNGHGAAGVAFGFVGGEVQHDTATRDLHVKRAVGGPVFPVNPKAQSVNTESDRLLIVGNPKDGRHYEHESRVFLCLVLLNNGNVTICQ